MNITVNVEGVTIESVIGSRYDGEDDRRVPLTLGEACVVEAVAQLAKTPEWGTLRERVSRVRDEEIRRRVTAEIEAAVTSPVVRTDPYGTTIGEPTTLRQEIARIANEAVKLPTRSSGLSHQSTALEEIIRTEVDKALAAELKVVVDVEKSKVVEAVRAKAAVLIAEAIKQGLGR